MTPENHLALLEEADGKSKTEVQRLLARWFPQPDVPDTTRKLPPPRAAACTEPAIAAPPTVPPPLSVPVVRVSAAPVAAPAVIAPLSPDRYKVTFTADTETTELLELAKDMLSHAARDRSTAEVVKRALNCLVRELARKKFGVTDRRRASRGPRDDQDIPAAVKAEVLVRDRGRCAFVGTTGRRCGSRAYTEFHHVIERSQGGKGTVENTQLRCGAHNRYEAHYEDGHPKRPVDPGPPIVTRSGPIEAARAVRSATTNPAGGAGAPRPLAT